MERIHLTLRETERACEIFVGRHLLDFMVEDLTQRPIGKRLGIVTDHRVEQIVGEKFRDRLFQAGVRIDMVAVGPGEESKRWETVQTIFEWMTSRGFDRKSALLSLGGGVVGDITGFVASLYMRSIPYAQIPTTLLAQVDSSLGGKTAIDFGARKNLLGTFYQPERVYVDPSLLFTLSPEEFQNGLAEVIKTAIVRDSELFRVLEDRRGAIATRETDTMVDLIQRCCWIKSAVVMEDERDAGIRQILNFGHTVGHAIEAHTGYGISHGRAVSMGMAAETLLSARMNLLPFEEAEKILQMLHHFDLPTRIPGSCSPGCLVALMQSDKKTEDGKITVVLPEAIGRVSIKKGVSPLLIESVLEEVCA